MTKRIFNVVHSDMTGHPIEVLSYGHPSRKSAEGVRCRLARSAEHRDHILVIHEVVEEITPSVMIDADPLYDDLAELEQIATAVRPSIALNRRFYY